MDNYQSWKISIEKYQAMPINEVILASLRFGLLAPSTHNSQPWQIELKSDSKVKITIPKQSLLPVADPTNKDAFISLGCFVENTSLAANHFGFNVLVKGEFSDNVLLCNLEINFSRATQENNSINEKLFLAIVNRVNARLFFETGKQVPNETISGFEQLSESKLVTTKYFQDPKQLEYLAVETGNAVKDAQSKKEFRKEFSTIVKNNLTKSKIGMPAFSFGIPTIISFVVPKIFKYFDVSNALQKVNTKAMRASSAVIIISGEKGDRESWIECGRVLERQLLYWTSQGIGSSIHIAMADLEKYSAMLQNDLGIANSPYMVYRVGYTTEKPRHTPRKSLEDCLVK